MRGMVFILNDRQKTATVGVVNNLTVCLISKVLRSKAYGQSRDPKNLDNNIKRRHLVENNPGSLQSSASIKTAPDKICNCNFHPHKSALLDRMAKLLFLSSQLPA